MNQGRHFVPIRSTPCQKPLVPGNPFRIRVGKYRKICGPIRLRQFAPLHLVDLRCQFRDIEPDNSQTNPTIMRPRMPVSRFADTSGKMFANPIRDEELRVLGPSVAALDKADLFIAKRFAVGLRSILLVRGTVADVAVENDESGPAFRLPKSVQGMSRCDRCRWRPPLAKRSTHNSESGLPHLP